MAVPLSLNFLAVPRNNEKIDYDGILRLVPFLQSRFEKGKKTALVVGATLELLGKRSLFSTKWDEL